MYIKNVMEEIVIDKVNETIDTLGCCTCDVCKSDIVAYTLNHVKPKYVTSEKGGLFSKLSEESKTAEIDIIRNIIEAAEKVKKSPRHK